MLRIDASPSRFTTWTLSWFLFAAGIALYFYTSYNRHLENPEDKVVPSLGQLAQGATDAFLKPDSEQENAGPAGFFTSMLWTDTVASAKRFAISMALLIPAVLLRL